MLPKQVLVLFFALFLGFCANTSVSFVYLCSNARCARLPALSCSTDDAPVEGKDLKDLKVGLDEGFYVIKEYPRSPADCGYRTASGGFGSNVIFDNRARPQLTNPNNVTLPLALMILDAAKYPSLSSARKACRKGNIIIDRASDGRRIRGRAADRVVPSDLIQCQARLSNCFYPSAYASPPFDLPVLFEDEDFAVVNKPAGVVTYSHKKGGHGKMTMRAGLPYVLHPPKGKVNVLRRPAPVHRLDKVRAKSWGGGSDVSFFSLFSISQILANKARSTKKGTSGAMVVAKTKGALVELSRAFAERLIEKTYVAILNGLPDDGGRDPETGFSEINVPVAGKEAVTYWKVLSYSKSLKAEQGFLTFVEFRPKTGRFHQLRFHASKVLGCPIIGDTENDGGTESALKFREKGMFLSATEIVIPHPTLKSMPENYEWSSTSDSSTVHFEDGVCEDDRQLMLTVKMQPPEKFMKLLAHEAKRASDKSLE